MRRSAVDMLATLACRKRRSRRTSMLPRGMKVSVGVCDFMSKIFNE
ncbi:MAG TPA: hypothetical protein P5081_06985 [Phycisphaerae bacterium]|nr:hypothetical protein [Phycisphaerae bacterium]HRW52617.1 hypothetical protein [Phycisphaerae bacterium]